MKRHTYDVVLKLTIASEYATSDETYTSLSRKYNIPRATIASWIQKSKNNANGLTTPLPETRGFLNITNAVVAASEEQSPITIVINGLEIKSDLNTLLRLLQGAKHV